MSRFFHSVDKVIIADGDDVRRAPMAAALLREFANNDPLFRLWGTKVESAGTGETIVEGASPVTKAKNTMLKKGVNISSHKAEKITFDDIQESSVILTLTRKQAEDVLKNVLNYYPSYQTKIIPMLDYLGIKDWEFPKLIGATQFVYSEFVGKMESVLPLFKIKFKQDTYLPLLVKGKGLGVGIIKGPVRIIESDVQVGEIEQGDVVVCSTNDVAGLLGRAVSEVGAIITESWSELGELSQTSYKFNIPCISSTSHPADVLQNGELVLLDAITGSVYGYPSANMPIKTDNLPGQEPKLSLADILKKYNIKPKES